MPILDFQIDRPGAVTVLIGANGSGKSRELRRLCRNFLLSGRRVIAVAPTVFDRFRRMPRGDWHFYGARHGRGGALHVVRTLLSRAYRENAQVLKNVSQALHYTKFDPQIGVRILGLDIQKLRELESDLTTEQISQIGSALSRWSRLSRGDVVKFGMENYSFQELDVLSLSALFEFEILLVRKKIIKRIEYFFFRRGEAIPLLEACSGEIVFVTAVAFISGAIQPHSVIAVDEPETSLHPTWQKEYIDILSTLFAFYQPQILISTHSPIIISGADSAGLNYNRSDITVFELADGTVEPFPHVQFSLEEMYHYLSQRAVSLLNALNSGDRNLNEVVEELNEYKAKSYDATQKAVIDKVEEIARNLNSVKEADGE
jgi:hypothetical protein